MKKVMIIAAHPDDEVLGCGGTIKKFTKKGHEVITLILGEGKTSRTQTRDIFSHKVEIDELQTEISRANKKLGVSKVIIENFPDNRFDEISLLDIVKVLEKYIETEKPEIIFTHFSNDMNIDHQILNKAVLTATRPTPECCVKEVYSFEILSSTEWNFPLSFIPDYFVDITSEIEDKMGAMSEYASELREYPHPRSIEGIELNAKYWAMRLGINGYIEAFKTLRRLDI